MRFLYVRFALRIASPQVTAVASLRQRWTTSCDKEGNMQNYKCFITIQNLTTQHLKLVKQDIPWSRFQEGPEKDLMPRTTKSAFVASGNDGPAGTEGTVCYQFGDDANKTMSIYFDIPTRPFSDNKVNVDTSDPNLAAVLSGFKGSGNVEVCTIRVVYAPPA